MPCQKFTNDLSLVDVGSSFQELKGIYMAPGIDVSFTFVHLVMQMNHCQQLG